MEIGKEICPYPGCSRSGSSYEKHNIVNNLKNASKDIYCYLRFRHNDRTIKDHYIEGKDGTNNDLEEIGTEFKFLTNEVTTYRFERDDRMRVRQAHTDTACPIAIYELQCPIENIPYFEGICRTCLGPLTRWHDLRCVICDHIFIRFCPKCQSHWRFDIESDRDSQRNEQVKMSDLKLQLKLQLRKSNVRVLTLKELNKFLKNEKHLSLKAKEFGLVLSEVLKDKLNDILLTYGDNAHRIADKISESDRFSDRINIKYLLDSTGILEKIENRIIMIEKLKFYPLLTSTDQEGKTLFRAPKTS